MQTINFDEIEDVNDFTPVPEGKYLCRVDDVEENTTQIGDPMWRIRHVIIKGEHQGRFIFDNLPFSPKGLRRVKFICAKLGFDATGTKDLTPEDLMGRTCWLTAGVGDYEDSEGVTKKRNQVPFAGYEAAEDSTADDEDDDDDDLPF